ncbi:MAG: hypothetical protein JWO94_2716 [Verrucomicrobiaceae bacterium]|nr:hypothetical protein [Verrucomicrobiaceae bacterium]
MKFVIEFLAEALNDAEKATKYYESCLHGLGVRFRAELEDICSVITHNPLLWNERSGGHRRVNFAGFPFYVAYIIRNERVVVTAVGHACRHPDYWRSRKTD